MRITIKKLKDLAAQKQIAYSVSRYGKKYGYEYWTQESIKATGEATQFKGDSKSFYNFLNTL